MSRSSIIAGVVLFAGLLTAGGTLALHKAREIQAEAAGGGAYEPSEAVDIVAAREVNWQPTSDLVGTVIAIRSVLVSNEIAGVVRSVGFQSGDVVEQGQVLIALDDATAQADLQAARASVRVAQANVLAAESRIDLGERMVARLTSVEGRAIAEADVDRARAEVDSARAELARWNAEVDQAAAHVLQVETRLAKLTIRAPFRARAGMRGVHDGQYLQEGSEIVLLQELTDTIYLDFAIPQAYAPRVAPGTAVMATADLLGPDPVRIEVVATDATVSSTTRNLRVRAVVDNASGTLLPGMFIQIRVPVEAPRRYVVVPGTAIRRAAYGDSIFVVRPGEVEGQLRVVQRFVSLGQSIGQDIIVSDGLQPGEQVVATGSFKLRDGSLVAQARPAPAPPQAAAGTPPGENH